ncbi:chemotaxis response regulator protein-glutamate methylesterase [Paenibacillus oenotherae]|uniref:Protein-glutamate methylesterase/protein-glutamine glutaminase n=1 Tax=Paenibacillus oenotherae TaxID=1435645 RepID=A0ABS7D086_9BACL|nr:chemotaxis response regulator protein-glutamate methylesterase [Paenibacillus oenotherae]MBW7473279.1 chemotaxis response regulator protein-glutamate methylesterase [Paenibacillus oenotherae]
MSPYRVLVVDDSAFMRKIFCDLIASDKQFEIVATATNGYEAIDSVERLKPDVITMDLEMPEMNGLEALERIMRTLPTPIIMLSSISDDATRETIKALQIGAFDFIRKPSGPLSPDIHKVGEMLLEKMRIAVLTKRVHQTAAPIEKPAPKLTPDVKLERTFKPRPKAADSPISKAPPDVQGKTMDGQSVKKPVAIHKPKQLAAQDILLEPHKPVDKKPQPSSTFQHLITIGTSTGGPRALHEVITALPGDLPAPVLVVQHMPPKFTHSLAQRLDTFSNLRVVEATNGERVNAGMVYIAPGGNHMELAKDSRGYYIRLTQEPTRNGHRPSVDVMFESCTSFKELRRHSVIMTGMGSDGVKGMKALNESGGESAIAEAEESCVVYGMPRSAIEAGVAKTVVPLRQIASRLVEAVMK